MQAAIAYIILFSLIIAIGFSIYYSVRFRREQKPDLRGLLQAKQNISMGIMLTLLALHQFVNVTGSSVGVVIGALFLLIGLFNLFAGIRNRTIYRVRLAKTDQ